MLEIVGVTLKYRTQVALDQVNLQVGEGELVALLGPSGSGKTSLLRIITGLEEPDEGEVVMEGRAITKMPVHERQIGLMFQDYALFPHLTVVDNVAFGLRMQGRPRREVVKRALEVLSWVELERFADRQIESLSGGEQQRVALARSLAPQPRLLMLDEPVGALDRALRTRLIADLSTLLRRIGIAAIYVTHDQDEAFALADRVAVIHQGKIQQVATPQELWESPHTEFVARFLGFENFAPAQVRDGQASGAWGRVPVDLANGDYQVVIRPEGLSIDPAGPISGVVISAGFAAGRTRLQVEYQDGMLSFETTGAPPAIGEAVQLAVNLHAIHIFPQLLAH